jgi:Ni/Co efflux regulator RcnB
MKTLGTLTKVVALAALVVSSGAMAQYGPDHRDDRRDDRDHRDPGPDMRRGPGPDMRRGPGPGPVMERGRGPEFHGDYHRRWSRGDRLPPEYRNRQYVIEDYRPYNLSPPPRGYQWISVNSDFVLAAIATGVVASVVLGR